MPGNPGNVVSSVENPAYAQNLRLAIKTHKLVQYTPAGTQGLRFFAPHALYKATTGKLHCAGYEMGAPRGSMREEAFRTVELGHIAALSMTSYHFNPHPTFSSAGRKYEGGVICAVDRP